MNAILNSLAKLAEWAGDGDHFIGFIKIVVVLVVVVVAAIVAVFVAINIMALSEIPG